jgi:hypothetical protein
MFTKYLLCVSFISLTILLFNGCADQITSEADILNQSDSPPKGLSSFSEIQKNIFTPNCALSGCHGDINPQHNLNLTSGKAYSSLVNVSSIHIPGMKRVSPGNSRESVLYRALTYELLDLQMPPTGKLSQSTIDSIAAWIDKGAPND